MNADDNYDYWEPAAVALFPDLSVEDSEKALECALGCTDYTDFIMRPAMDDFHIPEEKRKLLKALAGPHGKAILRAYQIQRGIKHDVDA